MRSLLVACTLLISVLSFAQQKLSSNSFVRPLPDSAKAVFDFGNFLTPAEETMLGKELKRYGSASGNALVIITLDSLTDPKTKKQYTIDETAMLYFNTWGIGDKRTNNGVLLMATKNPRRVRIEVGRGLEQALTNPFCAQVIEKQLVPNFKKGAFATGFLDAIKELERKLDNASTASVDAAGSNVQDIDNTAQPVPETSYFLSYLSIGKTLFSHAAYRFFPFFTVRIR